MEVRLDWNTDKNRRLVEQRAISFEVVASSIENGEFLDVYDHPNQERYPGQFIYVVEIDDYVYLVPFVLADDGTQFLKTIIPSRKARREYGSAR